MYFQKESLFESHTLCACSQLDRKPKERLDFYKRRGPAPPPPTGFYSSRYSGVNSVQPNNNISQVATSAESNAEWLEYGCV